MSIDEAIRTLRASPAHVNLVRDAYLGRNVKDSAERFLSSAEFQAVRVLLHGYLEGAVVLDMGAGTGIASYAMLAAGAGKVIALEPDPSDEVGRGAIGRLSAGPWPRGHRRMGRADRPAEQLGRYRLHPAGPSSLG